MWLIILILMAIAISALFSLFENNYIATRTVINCRDGPSWTSELPLVSENLIKRMKARSFFQYPSKYVGKNAMIISKILVDAVARFNAEVRNSLKVWRCFLKKVVDDVRSFFKKRYSYVCSRC